MAQHKDDPAADIGTAKQQPRRPEENFKQQAEGTADHFLNFFEAIRTGRQPIENVDFGCGTAVACHMANISYREKKRVMWDAERQKLSRA